MSIRAVQTADVGRKPSDNPKKIHLGLRIDEDLASVLDAEVERLTKAHPGLVLIRSDVVRMLIVEAIDGRKRTAKK